MSDKTGKIYLLPTSLGENNFNQILPPDTLNLINSIKFYIVENIRSARRFFSAYGIETPIDDLTFFKLNKHTKIKEIDRYLIPVKQGENVGILSEAGLPGIADPGNIVVQKAHELNIRVIPVTGPSSIILALIASGFNGQNFVFNGYLPIHKSERIKKLKELESMVFKSDQTQLFMEAPYRNQKFLEDILSTLSPASKLCIACDITLKSEFIKTKSVKEWKRNIPDINKRPTIFAIGKG